MAEFRMPALGADMQAGTLVAWRKKPGERVERGDIIAEVETDKGVIEVEVYVAGVVERHLVEAGQRVPVGTPLAIVSEAVAPTSTTAESPINLGAEQPPSAAAARPALSPLPTPAAAPPPMAAEASSAALGAIAASPAVRRRARELGVDLRSALLEAQRVGMSDVARAAVAAAAPVISSRAREPQRVGMSDVARAAVAAAAPRSSPAARRRAQELGLDLRALHGSGPEGAIVLADVEATTAASPQPSAAAPSDPRRALRRAIGAAMARSKRDIPHYYLTTSIDLGRAQAWLTSYNLERSVDQRIVAGALLLKAVALAAKQLPDFNCLWQDDDARRMAEIHLGVAIALRGGGLIAPAIHRADTLGLADLMRALSDLVARARAGSLRSSELSDGTITVTSLGERGVDAVLPIIYPPQTAIVGFGRIVERPWVVDSALAVRPVVTASLAADHRVTDGHLGARFLNLIEDLLQHPEQL